MALLNTLLILAMLAVALVLVTGLISFFRGGSFNDKYGNKLMRARVGLQCVALILIAIIFLAR